uniref:Uncharacterized protein n=1 Tax=Rhizophora mucronata TaxID=61149 RepID=A0A2P2PBI2_RHIMU
MAMMVTISKKRMDAWLSAGSIDHCFLYQPGDLGGMSRDYGLCEELRTALCFFFSYSCSVSVHRLSRFILK